MTGRKSGVLPWIRSGRWLTRKSLSGRSGRLRRDSGRTVARDLIASVERFNKRWGQFLEALNLDPINQMIDQYNTYYVLEKECVMGSPRLAARHFRRCPGSRRKACGKSIRCCRYPD